MSLTVYGFKYSVYCRILYMQLHLMDLPHERREVDPFATPADPVLAGVTPFGRVPVLDHDGFVLQETSVICRYLAHRFDGADLIPVDPQAAARMCHVIAVIDSYGYRALVRQVFSHAVFRPMIGAPGDPSVIAAGLAAAGPVLGVLEQVAQEGKILTADRLSLADLHLAPMIGYFDMARQGRAALKSRPALHDWFDRMRRHDCYVATQPPLATTAAEA